MEPVQEQVAAARRGDANAITDLVRSVWPDAYRIAWSILQDHADAEDAAQDACARMMTTLASLRDPARFGVWFYRIVVNQARQKQREHLRRRDLTQDTHVVGLTPDERIDVARAIAALDPSLRIVIVLRYFYDLNSSEISAVLGINAVTVRWRLMRAHRRLRPLLEPQQHPQGECLDEPLASS
jgi:RNA polymerase sigma-70 factor (ECF subfamily)